MCAVAFCCGKALDAVENLLVVLHAPCKPLRQALARTYQVCDISKMILGNFTQLVQTL